MSLSTENQELFAPQASRTSDLINIDHISLSGKVREILKLAVLASRTSELDVVEALLNQAVQRSSPHLLSSNPHIAGPLEKVCSQLLEGQQIHVALINDNGFYAGAGIATSRQAQSLLLAGHLVSVIALNPAAETIRSQGRLNEWLLRKGLTINFVVAHQQWDASDRAGNRCHREWISKMHHEYPIDLAVIGNLHSDAISWSIVSTLIDLGTACTFYCHDIDLITGGCAYPQYYDCKRYKNGCLDSDCPKPEDAYPHSSYLQIRRNYLIRTCLPWLDEVGFLTNSTWTLGQVNGRFVNPKAAVSHLAVDVKTYAPPADRQKAKKTVGLEQGCFTIAIGADSLSRQGKGGELVRRIIDHFRDNTNIQFLSFGHATLADKGIIKLGYLETDIEIAQVFQAADVFLNPVSIEAFGQTFLEASASGCVPIGLRVGGAADIVRDEYSGFLVENERELIDRLELLAANGDLRSVLSANAREYATQHFSLERQYIGILTGLMQVSGVGRQHDSERKKHNEKLPLISIITTTLNCENDLKVTIASLRMQSFHDFEWILQDGLSQDRTLEIAQNSGLDVQCESNIDEGIYDAMNRAVRRARGQWVLFLQAGDWLAGSKALQTIVETCGFQNDIILAGVMEVDIQGQHHFRPPIDPTFKVRHLMDGSFKSREDHWLKDMPCHQGILMRRELLERDPFDISYRISADWHQLLRTIKNGSRVELCNNLLSWYPNGGFSHDNSDLWIEDVIRIAKDYCDDHELVDSYFQDVLQYHKGICKKRNDQRDKIDTHLNHPKQH